MAKIPFTKLGLKIKNNTKEVKWNDQTIEVKQYLPTAEKLELIARIIGFTGDDNVFYNPCRLEIFENIWLIMAYTNINITDKQSEDLFKLYDLFYSSGFLTFIKENIPKEELDYIHIGAISTIDEIYKYKNSAQGVMAAIVQDYKDTELDASKIMETISDPESLQTIKTVVTELH